MVMDLAVELIQATVQLEQPLGDGTRTVGTGFLISAPGPDGQPRTVLITANHVFQKMPGGTAKIGYRRGLPDPALGARGVLSARTGQGVPDLPARLLGVPRQFGWPGVRQPQPAGRAGGERLGGPGRKRLHRGPADPAGRAEQRAA